MERALEEIAKALQQFRSDTEELATVRATLLVNFGPTSQSKNRYGFQIDKEGLQNNDEQFIARLESAKQVIGIWPARRLSDPRSGPRNFRYPENSVDHA